MSCAAAPRSAEAQALSWYLPAYFTAHPRPTLAPSLPRLTCSSPSVYSSGWSAYVIANTSVLATTCKHEGHTQSAWMLRNVPESNNHQLNPSVRSEQDCHKFDGHQHLASAAAGEAVVPCEVKSPIQPFSP
jgi:hypothetical protein